MSTGPEIRIFDLAPDKHTSRERLRTARARQRAIGRELRRMYDDVARSPLPEEFLELLRKIDEVAARKMEVDEPKKML